MQVDPAFQADGTGKPDARRDVQVPAALFFQGRKGLPERFRVQADAIRASAEILQGHARNGNLRGLRLGQVLIQVRIIACLHPSAQEAGHQQGYSVFFHLSYFLTGIVRLFAHVRQPAAKPGTNAWRIAAN